MVGGDGSERVAGTFVATSTALGRGRRKRTVPTSRKFIRVNQSKSNPPSLKSNYGAASQIKPK